MTTTSSTIYAVEDAYQALAYHFGGIPAQWEAAGWLRAYYRRVLVSKGDDRLFDGVEDFIASVAVMAARGA